MPIISVPDNKFTQFLEKREASKRTAQKATKKQDLKEAPSQATLLGSQTRDWDNDLQTVVKMNREEVGSPNPPTFWALEIARSIRDFGGVLGKDAYDAVIKQAKLSGLNKSQQEAIDQILIYWRIPVPGLKEKDNKPNGSPFGPVASDSTINFPQRQVAATLKNARELTERVASLEMVIAHYNVHKASLNEAYDRTAIKRRVAQLLKQKFSRADIATDMASWHFPKSLVREAISRVLPKKIALSNGNPLSLSNGTARIASSRKGAAEKKLQAHFDKQSKGLSEKQSLRLSALASRFQLDTPFWIRKAQSNKPIEAMAKMKDGRVLCATISPTGECQYTTNFEPMLKKSIRTADSVESGWTNFLISHRSAQFDEQTSTFNGELHSLQGEAYTNDGEEGYNRGYSAAFADNIIELLQNDRVVSTYAYPEEHETTPKNEGDQTINADGDPVSGLFFDGDRLEFVENEHVLWELDLHNMIETESSTRDRNEEY